MAETQPKNYLHDLIIINSNPDLKVWLDAVRLARGKKIFAFLNDRLPEEPCSGPYILEGAEGSKTIAAIRLSEEPLPKWSARFVFSATQISETGGMQVANDAITASLLYPDPGTRETEPEEWSVERQQPYPLFTVRGSGEIYGPVSDISAIESFLALSGKG